MRRLGQSSRPKKDETFSVDWLLGGIALGAGGWFLFRHLARINAAAPSTVDPTVVSSMPPIASPARYADLRSVDIRRDQLKTLYQAGRLTPEQTLLELGDLIVAADALRSTDPVLEAAIHDRITNFIGDIYEFIEFKRQSQMTGNPVSLRRVV